MTDTYLTLVNSGITKEIAKKLGLPRPAVLRRFDPSKPLVPGPVLVLGKGESADTLASLLLSWQQDVRRHATPKEKLGAILMVLDEASGPEDLGAVSLDAGASLRDLAPGGRVVTVSRPASEAQDHQVHPVHQHRGHFHRIGPRFRDHRDPAQVGAHLRRGQQTDIRLTDDRDVTPGRCHGRHHAQLQRTRPGYHCHSAARQRIRKHLSQRIGHRQQTIRRLRWRRRRRHRSRCPTVRAHPAGDRRDLFAKLFYLLSARGGTPVHALRCRHSCTFHPIRPIRSSKLCSMSPVNTSPPTSVNKTSAPRPCH